MTEATPPTAATLRMFRGPSFIEILLLALSTPFAMLPFVVLVTFMSEGEFWHVSAGALLLAAVGPLLWWIVRRQFGVLVTVGQDGVHLEERRSATFIPLVQIHRVVRDGQKLTLRLRGGGVRVLRASQMVAEAVEIDAVVARLAALRWEHRRLEDQRVALFERGETPVERWIADARAMVRTEGYRSLSLDPDRLWAIVENPALEVSQRAGAALALHDKLDESGKTRLRVADDASASPTVREALEAVAEEDDEELSRALMSQ